MYSIEDKIERADIKCFKKADFVYVLDQHNLYDMFKAEIKDITENGFYIHYPEFPEDDEVASPQRILPLTPKNNEEYERQQKIREQKERMNYDEKQLNYTKNETKIGQEKLERTKNHLFKEGEIVFIRDSDNQLYEGVIKMIVSMKYLIRYPECKKEEEFVDIVNIFPNTEKNRREYIRQDILRFENDDQINIDEISFITNEKCISV